MKILNINSVCDFGSTGRVVRELADILIANEHDAYIAYGYGNTTFSQSFKIGGILENHFHNLFFTRFLGFHDYNCLQMNAFAVVSDSGTLPEESSFFTSVGHSFPAVCIRTSTERPEALDKGCFNLAGINEHDLLQAVDVAVEMVRNEDNGIPVPNYTDENVSTKIVKLIQSYTGVVNKMVWRKE